MGKLYERGLPKGVHDRARKVVEGERLREENFGGIYTKEVIEKDLADLQKRELQFEEDRSRQFALILEAIIYTQIREARWLGEHAAPILTSRFDDVMNGVDTIVKIGKEAEGPSHLAFGVDVTFSTHLGDKFKNIKEKIKGGLLAGVRYFQPQGMELRGKTLAVPLFVVGADIDHVIDLAELWMGDSAEDKRLLKRHQFQVILLEQIRRQAEAFELYARDFKRPEVADAYLRVGKIIGEILRAKIANQEFDRRTWKRDNVFAAIVSRARLVKGRPWNDDISPRQAA